MRPAIAFQNLADRAAHDYVTVLTLALLVIFPGQVPAQFVRVRTAFRAGRRSELVPEKQTAMAVERLSPVFNDRAIGHTAEKNRPADEATDAPVFGYGKS
ncbi:hypothetical protein FIV06_01655 [Labrenzia sp. THAF191b]|nr:hypothetical protein FIV06_01655 [Labrenzia sp. THAF191b]QFT02419.1 hypothetical protein FIV05_01655 [Labrenzia sp. THAF191a]QFT13961.1 hypothetical protein FIV03_01660 [Labrenzia sp. THAF187b]